MYRVHQWCDVPATEKTWREREAVLIEWDFSKKRFKIDNDWQAYSLVSNYWIGCGLLCGIFFYTLGR